MAKQAAAATAIALFALAALAGCGPLGDSDEDEAGDVLLELVEARNQGEFGTVCELLSSDALAKFRRAGVGCEQTLRRRFGAGTTTTIRIDEVRVSGDRATVDATVSQVGGAGRAQTFRLVKEDDEWRFES